MFTLYNGLAVALVVSLAPVSLALLLLRGETSSRAAAAVRRGVGRLVPSGALRWIDWRTIALIVGIGYAAVAGVDLLTGNYECAGIGLTSDPVALLHSGQAFWAGGSPFLVGDCGVTTEIPYGLAAIGVNAVGSLGGLAGIAAAWGLVAVAVLPLVWYATPEPDRRYVTLFVALLPIYFPLVADQIDGASNAIVPVAVLATIVLGARFGRLGELLGGFLSTARFPTLFPVVAARGGEKRWLLAGLTAIGAFALTTLATYARWGSGFYRVVFESQVNRRSFSLNLYGILLDHALLPTGTAIVVAQAGLIVGITAVAFFLVRTPLRAAAVTLVGYALVTPFLSFSILLALVPVALVGQRPRYWLWGVAIVGALNYDLALTLAAWQWGVYLPTDLLDAVLTVLLVGLFAELLWRRGDDLVTATSGGPKPLSAAGSP